MVKTRSDIEKELNEFCPELHPIAHYAPHGIRVRCIWEVDYIVDPTTSIEYTKQEMLNYLYEHLGKLTVLVHKFEEDLK